MTKRRNPIKTMTCDHLLYEDENGQAVAMRAGQWVTFKRKQSSRDYRRMLHFAAVAEDADAAGGLSALEQEFASLSEFLSRKIVAWNWTDLDREDGELLKDPPDTDTLDDLDFDDLLNLLDLYMEGTTNAKKV
jgi:hypothetical protein